jgi:hypothetical protein
VVPLGLGLVCIIGGIAVFILELLLVFYARTGARTRALLEAMPNAYVAQFDADADTVGQFTSVKRLLGLQLSRIRPGT